MQNDRFEWHDEKAESNRRKHRVEFDEAETVFDDDCRITAFDPEHSKAEDRWTAIGTSSRLRVLVVTYTRRGSKLRLITARKAAPWERELYEEGRT